MQCGCQQSLRVEEVEELESDEVFVRFHCDACGWAVGAEGRLKEIEPLVPTIIWSNEAHYHLSRLPPYLASLVRDEVEPPVPCGSGSAWYRRRTNWTRP